MQKLILITGEAWTGKTTVAKQIYKKFNNSAWLDGDDVWRVNPCSFDDPRLRNSDLNMAFVVENYLQSEFDYIFFSSVVLCNKQIRNRILNLINYSAYEIFFFVLYATKDELRKRARLRDGNLNPKFRLLEQSLNQNAIFINTTRSNSKEILMRIKKIIDNPHDFDLVLESKDDYQSWVKRKKEK